ERGLRGHERRRGQATPTLVAAEATLAAEQGASMTMATKPQASSAPAQVRLASEPGDTLASSIGSGIPTDPTAAQPIPLPTSNAVADTPPDQSTPDPVSEQPDATTTPPSPPTAEPSPTPTKPSPPATI